MSLKERQALIRKVERLRNRRLIVLCNLDRRADPEVPGLSMQFQEDMKEPLYRVLKETLRRRKQFDVVLYTRGGATHAVWPVVSLLREFDPDFEVLIPFRSHSSGTMLAMAAKKIVMTPIGELSPIDPTTANAFNPRDPSTKGLIGIAVEDVTSYREFWKNAIEIVGEATSHAQTQALMQPHLARLATEIHPLALGNVHRTYTQIRVIARMILGYHYNDAARVETIIDRLTKEYYSHIHMINRHEAREIFSDTRVEFADDNLSKALDNLLMQYENDFEIRHAFFLSRFMADEVERDARFIAGVIESGSWSYLYETLMKFRQYIAPPQGITIQIPPGQIAPLVPGLPRKYEIQVVEQGWRRNREPKGVTL